MGDGHHVSASVGGGQDRRWRRRRFPLRRRSRRLTASSQGGSELSALHGALPALQGSGPRVGLGERCEAA